MKCAPKLMAHSNVANHISGEVTLHRNGLCAGEDAFFLGPMSESIRVRKNRENRQTQRRRSTSGYSKRKSRFLWGAPVPQETVVRVRCRSHPTRCPDGREGHRYL